MKKKTQSLKSRAEEVLDEMGSDPRFADDFIKGLQARGVTFVLGRTRCRCFPRTKRPKKMSYGKYQCMNCKLLIDHEFDRKVLASANVLVMPVMPKGKPAGFKCRKCRRAKVAGQDYICNGCAQDS